MGTEVKCNIKACKFQFDELCTRGEIEIVGDDPKTPDMALCQTMTIEPLRKNDKSKPTMTEFIGRVPAEEKIDSVKEHDL